MSGQGASGFKAHLIDGSEEARDDRRKLVGNGAELGGGEERRRGCSGKGSTA